MDGVPEELLLHIFGALCYNDLRPVLATCAGWRTLAQQCRAFWADIQTPGIHATASDARVFYKRLACARGRGFTLRLTGASPDILDAIARSMGQVEHLVVRLDNYAEAQDAFRMLRRVSAPRLRALNIRLGFASTGALPDDLFSGTPCPVLDRVHLSAHLTLSDNPLPCFAGVRDVRLDSVYSLHPSAPDIFAHFPAVRLLDLRALSDVNPEDVERDHPEFSRRLRASDWARLRYLGLQDDSWMELTAMGCPLQQIPHVFAETLEVLSLPFPLSAPTSSRHLVVEMPARVASECFVRLGNADWSASRGTAVATVGLWRVRGMPDVASASVSWAALPALSQTMRMRCPETLRIVLRPGNTDLRMDEDSPLESSAIRTLVFCCPAAGRCARITRRDAIEFARAYLCDAPFPLRLQLENVVIDLRIETGPQPQFASFFGTVDTRAPNKWSYLRVRDMLNRYDD